MRPAKEPVSPHHVYLMLLRQRRKIAVFFCLVMGLAGLVIAFMPRAYRSQAKLLVRLGRENAALDPTASFGQAPVVALPATRENDMNSALEILTSRFLLEKVVSTVGANAILGRGPVLGTDAAQEDDPIAQELAAGKLARKLDVEAIKKSNVISIKFDGPSPEVAQAVVSHLINCYLERYAHVHRTPGAHRFLADQVDRLHAQMTHTEEELRKRKEETGLFSPEGQRKAQVARLALLDDELLKSEASRAAVEAEVKALHARLDGMSRTEVAALTRGLPNQVADLLRGQLFALKQKELDLLTRHGSDHAEVRLVRGQMKETMDTIAREEEGRQQITMGPNRLYEEGQIALLKQEAELASLKARTEALKRQRDQERATLGALVRGELAVARLERDLEVQTLQYRKYAESREQAELDQSLEAERISNISVVQPATADTDPVRPRPLLYMALAFLIAVVGSFGLGVLCENLEGPPISTPAVEQTLGSPMHTSPPYQHDPVAVSNGAG